MTAEKQIYKKTRKKGDARDRAVARKFPREGPNQDKGKIFACFLCKRDQNRTKTVKM